MKTNVSFAKCETYDFEQVFAAVRKAVDLIGGISAFIKPGEKILLKPNLLSAKEPERHITTHPEVVRAMIRLVREAGATPLLGDSPGGAIKGVARVWEQTGMKKLADEENVELVNFETIGAVEKNIHHPAIKAIYVSKAVFDCDGIINIPKLKTHALMVFTGCIKNMFGIVPGLRKAEYHKLAPFPDEFGHLLGEIYILIKDKIRLNLVDGIVGMEGNGPSSGELRKMDVIVAGADGLAVDTAITAMLGFKPKRIEPFEYLRKKKAGEDDLAKIDMLGDRGSINIQKFKFPDNWYLALVPKFIVRILAKFVWMKPFIVQERCTNCMMCVNSCPVKTITVEPGKKPVVKWDGCISCLCCHELCVYNAIDLKSSPLAKILIRQ